MKKTVTSILMTVLLLAVTLLSLTACGAATSAGTPAGKAKNIVIGISPDYPPYDDLTADGKITGFVPQSRRCRRDCKGLQGRDDLSFGQR